MRIGTAAWYIYKSIEQRKLLNPNFSLFDTSHFLQENMKFHFHENETRRKNSAEYFIHFVRITEGIKVQNWIWQSERAEQWQNVEIPSKITYLQCALAYSLAWRIRTTNEWENNIFMNMTIPLLIMLWGWTRTCVWCVCVCVHTSAVHTSACFAFCAPMLKCSHCFIVHLCCVLRNVECFCK